MKQRILACLLVLGICGTFSITAKAGAYSSYSFTLDNRVVDGSTTGSYHVLDTGAAYISGSHYVYSTDSNKLSTQNTLYYSLVREVTGPDVVYGTVSYSAGQSPNGERIGTADVKSGRYYLQIFKLEDDGYNIKGSGAIYN